MKKFVLTGFVFFFICSLYSQQYQFTPDDVNWELNSLWKTYTVVKMPQITVADNIDFLDQFGDIFCCFTNGDQTSTQASYFFYGHKSDMMILFYNLGDKSQEFINFSGPDKYLLINEQNKNRIINIIKQWQLQNNLSGDFFD